jgi:hypothetical protein
MTLTRQLRPEGALQQHPDLRGGPPAGREPHPGRDAHLPGANAIKRFSYVADSEA